MAKRKRLKQCDLSDKKTDDDLQDRISQLPDEIVVHILSQMTLRQVVATSVLSKRWRNLWKRIPEFTFNASNMHTQKLSYAEKRLKTLKFVRWVDSILRQLIDPLLNISAFSVYYELNESVVSNIDQWVLFALKHDVQRLNLYLRTGSAIQTWCFPPQVAIDMRHHSLRHLSVGGCQLLPRFGSFKNLRLVSLFHVVISDGAFEDLLSSCFVLEELFVCGAKNLASIRIPASLVQLRSLQIYLCSNLHKMEVNAANLVSFVYFGDMISLSFNNISKLQTVRVCWVDDVLRRVMSTNLMLKTLILDFDIVSNVSDTDFKLFPVLTNLKVLDLYVASGSKGFVGFINLLRAVPSLRKFRLHLQCSDSWVSESDDRVTEKFDHKKLQEIELSGFSGKKRHIKLALFLIEGAVALEKIILVPFRKRWYLCRWLCEKTNPKQVDAVINCASQISCKLPAAAKLEILDR